ncbi:YkgJ family cysteine cluster protein, partial [Acinetobacter baumannii]
IYALRRSTCSDVQIADEQCIKDRLARQLIPVIQVSPAASENDNDYDQVR